MTAAVEDCWQMRDHGAGSVMECVDDLLSRCVQEPSEIGQPRTRTLFCYGAAIVAWDVVLADQWVHLEDQAKRSDAQEAAVPVTRQTRSQALPIAKAAWEAWREAECQYVASEFRTGTYVDVFASRCRIDLTVAQALRIEASLD